MNISNADNAYIEKAHLDSKPVLLQKYLNVDLSKINYSDSAIVISDRWELLWKKREQLLWIKNINSADYPVLTVISDYLNGKITKESITKIYKELTKNV